MRIVGQCCSSICVARGQSSAASRWRSVSAARAVHLVPRRRPGVCLRTVARAPLAQLVVEDPAEQLMQVEPLARSDAAPDEDAPALEVGEQRSAVGACGECPHETRREVLDGREVDEDAAQVGRQWRQYLRRDVVRHRVVDPEVGDDLCRVGAVRHGQRGQPQTGRPAFGDGV